MSAEAHPLAEAIIERFGPGSGLVANPVDWFESEDPEPTEPTEAVAMAA